MKRSQTRRHEQAKKGRQRRNVMISLVVLGGLIILIGVVLMRPQVNVVELIDLSDAQLVAQGENVYTTYCAACHGFELEGQPEWQQPNPDGSFRAPPHDETGHTWHHNDAYLIESVRLGGARLAPDIGVSAMPAYEDMLSDQQIAAVITYIKSTWPTDVLEVQATR